MPFTAPESDLTPAPAGGARTAFGDPVLGSTPATGRVAQDIGDSIIAGLQSSSMGLAFRGKLPDTQMPEDAPWHHRLAAAAGGLAGDMLPAVVGGAVGNRIGGPLGSMIGAFGVPMALREGLVTAYNHNNATSWEGAVDIAKSAGMGGAKGALIGTAVFAAGPAGLAGKAFSSIASPVARTAAAGASEVAALTAAASALEGHIPTWQDFMDNAILLGGMKSAVGIAKSMRSVYAETGKTPAEVAGDAKTDPTVLADLRNPQPRPEFAMTDEGPTLKHGDISIEQPKSYDKMGETEYHQSVVRNADGHEAGIVALGWRGDQAVILENIRTFDSFREEGIGSGVLRAILEHNAPDTELYIHNIQKGDARTWWEKRGAKIFDSEGGEDGTLTRADFERTTPRRESDGAAGAAREDSANESTASAATRISQATGTKIVLQDGARDSIKLALIEVPEAQRGNGVGSAALSQVKAYADATGRNVTLTAHAARAENQPKLERFYKDNGFVQYGKDPLSDKPYFGYKAKEPSVPGAALPQAYQPLALEQRIQAAVEKDPRPELVTQAFNASEGGAKLDRTDSPSLVKWDYVTDTDTAKGVLSAVTEHFQKEIDAQRRGTVSTTQSALDGLKLIADGKVAEHAVGQAFNDAQIRAIGYMLHDAANTAARAMERIRGVSDLDLTPGMKLEAYAAVERVAMLNAEFAGARAEAGRALNTYRAIKRDPSLSAEGAALVKLIEKKGPMQDIAALMKVMDDPAQLAKFAKEYTKATFMEKVIEAWKAGIFSGPQTVQANVIGNVGRFVVEVPEATIRASLAAVGAKLSGDPMTFAQFKARAFAPIHGLVLATQDGLKLAKVAADTINEGGLQGTAEVLKQANRAIGSNNDPGKLEQFRQANTGAFGELVQIPFKVLKATDMPFRNIGERAEAYIMAVDRVVKENLHPDTQEGREAIAKYLDDPYSGLDAEAGLKAEKRIEAAGAEAVFSQRLGPKMEAVQRAMQGTIFQFVVPVVRTPANLVSWALQHVPGLNLMSGTWRADYAAGGERQAAAVARVVTGTALTITAMSLAEQGILTGGGLFDKEDAGTKRGAGWQPYSFQHDGKYYGLQRIEPVAKVLGLSSDIYELAKAYKGQPEEQTKLMAMSVFMFANATISTTYLSGLANTLQAGLDPDRYLTNFLEQYASSTVPKAVGQTVTLNDPYQREVDGVMQAVQSQLPFLREKLLPKRDVWGEPVNRESLFGVMPVSVTHASEEKVRTEAMRLGLAIADVPKFLEEKGPFDSKDKRNKLSQEQRDVFKEVSGKNAMALLGPIVNAPDWANIPDFAKAAIYKNVIEGAREQGAYAALPADDVARVRLREQIVNKIIKQVQEADSATDTGRRLPFSTEGQPQDTGGRRLKFGGTQ